MFAALLYDCGGIRVKNHKSNDHQSAFSCPGLARNHAQMTWSRDDLHRPSFFHVIHNRFGLEASDKGKKKVNGQKLLQKLFNISNAAALLQNNEICESTGHMRGCPNQSVYEPQSANLPTKVHDLMNLMHQHQILHLVSNL